MFDTLTRMGASAAGAYEIDRSLRFNSGDSPYLTWTPSSSGNQQVMTWSFWYKRSSPGGAAEYVITAFNGTNTDRIAFANDDQLHIELKNGNATEAELHSKKLFRDPSAWYHIVVALDTTDGTTANRCKAYVNNQLITDWDTNDTISQNYSMSGFNTASKVQDIGAYSGSGGSRSAHCDGYMAELHFIDGQQLTPSSFGETDEDTGQWIPKKYVGTYGNEGYYLNFSDNSNTTSTTLGKDNSGNGNNWTPNNVAVHDSVPDTPTNNFCTFNPIDINVGMVPTIAEGGLKFTTASGNNHSRTDSTIRPSSGKWYAEFYFVSGYESTDSTIQVGILSGNAGRFAGNNDNLTEDNGLGSDGVAYMNNGAVADESSLTILTGLTTWVNDDIIGMAVDLDNDKLFISKNGTWFTNGTGTQDPANGTNPVYSGGNIASHKKFGFNIHSKGYNGTVHKGNYGQDSTFAGATSAGGNADSGGIGDFKYAPPSGFLALCTKNLPDTTIKQGSDYISTIIWEGTGSENARTGVGFSPNLVMIRSRENSGRNTSVFDTIRGANAELVTTGDSAEATGDVQLLKSFDADGFTLGTNAGVNGSSEDFVGWCWKESATAGFDIVSYTGNGSNRTISHNLGVKPSLMIIKGRSDASRSWHVWEDTVHTGSTFMYLNSSGANNSHDPIWNGTEPTSSVFSVGTDDQSNQNTKTYIAYLWSSVEGYSRFGSYQGNGNTNGTFVWTGFKPAYVMTKASDRTAHWYIWDSTRAPFNQVQKVLWHNYNSEAEGDHTAYAIDFLSNGFKVRNNQSDTNTSGSVSMYMAFAEAPFKYATAR